MPLSCKHSYKVKSLTWQGFIWHVLAFIIKIWFWKTLCGAGFLIIPTLKTFWWNRKLPSLTTDKSLFPLSGSAFARHFTFSGLHRICFCLFRLALDRIGQYNVSERLCTVSGYFAEGLLLLTKPGFDLFYQMGPDVLPGFAFLSIFHF